MPDWGSRGHSQGVTISGMEYQTWLGYQIVGGIPDSRWDARLWIGYQIVDAVPDHRSGTR